MSKNKAILLQLLEGTPAIHVIYLLTLFSGLQTVSVSLSWPFSRMEAIAPLDRSRECTLPRGKGPKGRLFPKL